MTAPTDLETLLRLVREDAPRASCLAIFDRIQARWRDDPADVVLSRMYVMADALLKLHDPHAGRSEIRSVESSYSSLRAALQDSRHAREGGGMSDGYGTMET